MTTSQTKIVEASPTRKSIIFENINAAEIAYLYNDEGLSYAAIWLMPRSWRQIDKDEGADLRWYVMGDSSFGINVSEVYPTTKKRRF